MQSIYEPKGKALEYCERAVNLYRGCGHGCRYCYAPNVLRMQPDDFAKPRARDGVLSSLAKQAPKHSGRDVLLCFTCDPYGPGTDETTRDAIQILHAAGCRVVVLTKGGQRSARDLDLLRPGVDRYGATLTFLDDGDSKEWEPEAASPIERLEILAVAKGRGIETWASFEPVIYPEQTLELIRATEGIVDVCKVGKWNYDKRANDIDWQNFAHRALQLGGRVELKKDLAAFLTSPPGEVSKRLR